MGQLHNKHLRRAKRIDRVATWVITAGGVAVIAVVILILLLILNVALPLFQGADVRRVATLELPGNQDPENVLALEIDEYLETGVVVDQKGNLTFFQIPDGQVLKTDRIQAPGEGAQPARHVEHLGPERVALYWEDGSITVTDIRFRPVFGEDGSRTISHRVEDVAQIPAPDNGAPLRSLVRVDESGSRTLVRQYEGNALQVVRVTIEEDLFGNQEQTEERLDLRRAASPITAIVADTAGETLFAGTQNGRLLRWDLRKAEAEPTHDVAATDEGVAIASLGMVFGDVSVAVGDATGGLSTWSLARDPDEASVTVLAKFHELPGHPEGILQIKPSYRTKTLLTRDTAGNVHATHMTSEQRLFELGASQPIAHFALATRDNGMLALGANGSLNVWTIDNPHPEVSFRTLFGKVWYERYDEPQYVWQSSASSDDFEPKLSLIPLIFGSFKGTFYAMLLAVPLAIFGAIYTSQFAEKRARGLIKSTVEIMAAVPSVVIGFLAALWFAPIVEHHVLVFLLWFLVLPIVFVAFMFLWQRLRRIPLFKPIQRGYEFLAIIPVILIGVVLAYYLAGGIERLVLGMEFKQWLFEVVGERYDQRNSIIIAFALGFAVIPIIFTITEDALSNVPFALRAASLALAATRWQTVWRVVLPSASPGIFAAIMVGFGRAVGETMIVLMATGNTPILDASIFNGMRTLSANIAVEVPEAPVGGTLYRVLFLSAVLLFVLTSVANTVAELVRHRLRKKYGQF